MNALFGNGGCPNRCPSVRIASPRERADDVTFERGAERRGEGGREGGGGGGGGELGTD